MGRCRGLYADVLGLNLDAERFFFFKKKLFFLALGVRGFGFRVRKHGSTIQ